MPFDFMKHLMVPEDDERFARLCEGVEDLIREAEDNTEKFTDLELMQALDYVGFNLFRDDWEEFKKMDFPREISPRNTPKGNNLIN
jgi:hypothetical protein